MIRTILTDFSLVIYIGACLLLILAVLMQRSKQDGLGAAFGGGLTETVFGAQTSTILIRFTSWLTGIFFLLALVLAYLYGHRHEESDLSRRLHAAQPAITAPATAPAVPAGEQPVTPAPANAASADSTTAPASTNAAAPAAPSVPNPVSEQPRH